MSCNFWGYFWNTSRIWKQAETEHLSALACFGRNQLSGIRHVIPESAPEDYWETNYLQEMFHHNHLWRWLFQLKITITSLWNHNWIMINRYFHTPLYYAVMLETVTVWSSSVIRFIVLCGNALVNIQHRFFITNKINRFIIFFVFCFVSSFCCFFLCVNTSHVQYFSSLWNDDFSIKMYTFMKAGTA